jgi:hypothetical protein
LFELPLDKRKRYADGGGTIFSALLSAQRSNAAGRTSSFDEANLPC